MKSPSLTPEEYDCVYGDHPAEIHVCGLGPVCKSCEVRRQQMFERQEARMRRPAGESSLGKFTEAIEDGGSDA